MKRLVRIILTTIPQIVLVSSVPTNMVNAAEPPGSAVNCATIGSSVFKSLGSIFNNFNGADPSKGLSSALCIGIDIFNIVLYFGGAIAVVMILYGALLYTTAYGDDAKAETAKKTIIWSVIGLVILAMTVTIVAIINSQIKK